MDKMIHTALNSLKMILQNQQITSQNISNASVIGYRKDANSEFGTAYLNGEDQLNALTAAAATLGAGALDQGIQFTENLLNGKYEGPYDFLKQVFGSAKKDG